MKKTNFSWKKYFWLKKISFPKKNNFPEIYFLVVKYRVFVKKKKPYQAKKNPYQATWPYGLLDLIKFLLPWGADFDVVLFVCDPDTPPPPSISTTKIGTPKRFGMVREKVCKNFFLVRNFCPTPRNPPW